MSPNTVLQPGTLTDTDTYMMRLESASMITNHLLQEWVAQGKLPFPFSFPWLITDPTRFPLFALWGFHHSPSFTHNCFVHAVIVTYSDFAINIHTSLFLSSWHGPCVQPIPDHSLEHETITTHMESMYWLLWFPAVYLMSTRTTHDLSLWKMSLSSHSLWVLLTVSVSLLQSIRLRPRYKCYWYTWLLLLRVLTMMELLIQATPDHIPCSDYWSGLASPVWRIDDMLHAGNAGNSLIVHHGNISVCLLNSTHYHWYHSTVSQLNECAFSRLNQYTFRRIYFHVIYMTCPLPHGMNLT